MRSYRFICGSSIFMSRFLLVCGSQLEFVLWWYAFLQFVSSFSPAPKFTWSISDTSAKFWTSPFLLTLATYPPSITKRLIHTATSKLLGSPIKIHYAQFKHLCRIGSNDNDLNAKAEKMGSFFMNRLYGHTNGSTVCSCFPLC